MKKQNKTENGKKWAMLDKQNNLKFNQTTNQSIYDKTKKSKSQFSHQPL